MEHKVSSIKVIVGIYSFVQLNVAIVRSRFPTVDRICEFDVFRRRFEIGAANCRQGGASKAMRITVTVKWKSCDRSLWNPVLLFRIRKHCREVPPMPNCVYTLNRVGLSRMSWILLSPYTRFIRSLFALYPVRRLSTLSFFKVQFVKKKGDR